MTDSTDRQKTTKRDRERKRERELERGLKEQARKKRETEGEIVWNKKNQEDEKEIATHRYERQRE